MFTGVNYFIPSILFTQIIQENIGTPSLNEHKFDGVFPSLLEFNYNIFMSQFLMNLLFVYFIIQNTKFGS